MKGKTRGVGDAGTRGKKKTRGDLSVSASPRLRVSASLPVIIVNPASAGGKTGDAWARTASDLLAHFGAFACAFTKGAGDARVIAEREARAGRRLIVACGGDGTISEVACGILDAGADAELGILPSGTGGDFRRTLGVPARAADAARVLREGRAVKIDAGRVEFTNRAGGRESRCFVNVASCGMGGEVIRRAKESDSQSLVVRGASALAGGRASYALASARAAVSFERPALRVRLDEKPERGIVVTNFCVANARYFGGGMKIAPDAKLADGLFDVVAVGDLGAAAIFANAHKLYLGTHLGMAEVHHARARRVSVAAAGEGKKVLLEVDGELVGRLPATFEVLPLALRVRVPAK